MSWVLVLMAAYMTVSLPGEFSSYETCQAAGKIAVEAKNTKIISFVCLPRT